MKGMRMDKIAKDYKFFRDHFYPEQGAEGTAEKPCPFCGSRKYKLVDKKRVCAGCGKSVMKN